MAAKWFNSLDTNSRIQLIFLFGWVIDNKWKRLLHSCKSIKNSITEGIFWSNRILNKLYSGIKTLSTCIFLKLFFSLFFLVVVVMVWAQDIGDTVKVNIVYMYVVRRIICVGGYATLVWPHFSRTLSHILPGLPVGPKLITSPLKSF